MSWLTDLLTKLAVAAVTPIADAVSNALATRRPPPVVPPAPPAPNVDPRVHVWNPYLHAHGALQLRDVPICTRCGQYQTAANLNAPCPGPLQQHQ